jgi:hypothetical protein
MVSALFKWGGRKDDGPSAAPSLPEKPPDTATTSKVLPKALAALSGIEAPVLLDLGPVVGTNISFFGEQLACKIFVEDLFTEVEKHAREGTREALAASLPARLRHAAGTIDGILCWDLFDYLDKASSQTLAVHLVSLLKPGGVLYAFFGATPAELKQYSRFVVESPTTLRQRSVPATATSRNVLVTRDINRMFGGLTVAESVLLKSNARETLFRKPS